MVVSETLHGVLGDMDPTTSHMATFMLFVYKLVAVMALTSSDKQSFLHRIALAFISQKTPFHSARQSLQPTIRHDIYRSTSNERGDEQSWK